MGLGNLVAAISTDDRDNNCVLLYRAPYEETHYSAAIRETEVAGGKTQREAMRTLAMRLTIRRLEPGESVTLPKGQTLTVRPEEVSEDRAILLPEGDFLPVRLRRVEGHWKVDARPIISARKAAAAAQQKDRGQ